VADERLVVKLSLAELREIWTYPSGGGRTGDLLRKLDASLRIWSSTIL